jgi:hypothetical protein
MTLSATNWSPVFLVSAIHNDGQQGCTTCAMVAQVPGFSCFLVCSKFEYVFSLVAGFFKHNTAGHGWTAVGGYFGVLTALFAWYNRSARSPGPARIAALRNIVCTDELAQVKEGTDELAQLKEGNNVCSKLPFFVWQPALEDVFRTFRLSWAVVPSSRRSSAITSTCMDKRPFKWPI